MDDKRAYFRAVGARIRDAREAVRMTGEQLGAALAPPVGHAAITRWEMGDRRIPLDRLDQVAALTGRAVSFFLNSRTDSENDPETDLDRELAAAFEAMRYASADDKRRMIEIMRALRRCELAR